MNIKGLYFLLFKTFSNSNFEHTCARKSIRKIDMQETPLLNTGGKWIDFLKCTYTQSPFIRTERWAVQI